jgi:hypothetical protein
MTRIIKFSILICVAIISLIQCRKDEFRPNPPGALLVDQTNVSFVIQMVLEDSIKPSIPILQVSTTGQTYQADRNGVVVIKNQFVPAAGLRVIINSPNHRTQEKLLFGRSNTFNSFHIRMKSLQGAARAIINTGEETIIDGDGKIKLPSVLLTESGQDYQGPVIIRSYFFAPNLSTSAHMMYGSFSLQDSSNALKTIANYGQYAFLATIPTTNESLSLKPGFPAQVSFPIAPNHQSAIPNNAHTATYNSSTGLWNKDFTAQKNGNFMVGEISSFDISQCLAIFDPSDVNISVKNQTGEIITDMICKFYIDDHVFVGYGNLDSEGKLNRFLPKGKSITMELSQGEADISSLIQTFTIGPFTGSSSQADLTVTAKQLAFFSGDVTNCTGQPVNDSYAWVDLIGRGQKLLHLLPLEGNYKYSSLIENHWVFFSDFLQYNDVFRGILVEQNNINSPVNQGNTIVCRTVIGSTISGQVFQDTDEDGLPDLPYQFVKVKASPVPSTGNIYEATADGNGKYKITCPEGKYEISVEPNSNEKVNRSGDLSVDGNFNEYDAGRYTDSLIINSYINLQEKDEDNNFLVVKKGNGIISGKIMVDLNFDGIGDKTAEGLVVTYENNQTGPTLIKSNASGIFSSPFIENSRGKLTIYQTGTLLNVKDYDETPDPDGDDSNLGPNRVIPVVLKTNETDADNNFVFALSQSVIVCTVLQDTNGDGIGDIPLPNQRVELYGRNATGVPISPTLGGTNTDAFGNVSFSVPNPGDYVLYFIGSGPGINILGGSDKIIDNNPPQNPANKQFIPVNIIVMEYDDGNTFIVR